MSECAEQTENAAESPARAVTDSALLTRTRLCLKPGNTAPPFVSLLGVGNPGLPTLRFVLKTLL